MLYIIKVLISALLIVAVSEVSKRSGLLGALLASLPLVSLLGILWLYWDTKNVQKAAELSTGIFWLVIPSLSFFALFPLLLKLKWSFYAAMGSSIFVMMVCYGVLMYFISLA